MSSARRSSPAGAPLRPPESGGISTWMCLLAITSSMCCSFQYGVRERDLGPVGDAGSLELAERGVDHRVQVGESPGCW